MSHSFFLNVSLISPGNITKRHTHTLICLCVWRWLRASINSTNLFTFKAVIILQESRFSSGVFLILECSSSTPIFIITHSLIDLVARASFAYHYVHRSQVKCLLIEEYYIPAAAASLLSILFSFQVATSICRYWIATDNLGISSLFVNVELQQCACFSASLCLRDAPGSASLGLSVMGVLSAVLCLACSLARHFQGCSVTLCLTEMKVTQQCSWTAARKREPHCVWPCVHMYVHEMKLQGPVRTIYGRDGTRFKTRQWLSSVAVEV